MTVIEQDIKAILTAGGVTESIFLGGFPEDDEPSLGDAVVAILSSGGPPPEIAMEPCVLQRKDSLQILARGAKDGYEAVRILADQIFAIVAIRGTETINGTVYSKVMATASPIGLPVDESQERPIFSINIEAWQVP